MPIRSNSIGNATTPPTMGGTSSVGQGTVGHGTSNNSLGVSEGQVIKGTVTDVHGNEVTIQMEDGTSFTGKLPDASKYSIGQEASFQVTNTSFQTVYMKALTDAYSLDEDDMVFKALEEAGLPKSPRNSELVRTLLDNQQSISRQSILDSLRLCAQFPEHSVDAVITMRHLGMPLTEENLTQFENYQNQTHQLLYKMDTLADNINQVLGFVGENAPEIGKNVADQILSLALEPSLDETMVSDTPLQSENILTPSSLITALGGEQVAVPSSLFNEDGTPILDTSQQKFLSQLSPDEIASITKAEDGTLMLQPDQAEEPVPLALYFGTLSQPEEAPSLTPSFEKGQVGFTLDEASRTELTNTVRELPIPNELKAGILDGSANMKDVLSALQKALPSVSASDVTSLLTSNGFQSLLKSQFVNGLTISPDTLKQEGSLMKLYEKMETQFSSLSRFQDDVFSQKSFQDLGKSAGNLQQNMNFMRTISDAFTYLQLPVNLSEQNAHGDLYVMTRKQSLKKNPNNLKVLLHLDMDHLGPLDIHISKENTNVIATFYVDSKSTAQLIQKNLDLLSDAINEQGYSFQGEATLQEKSIDIVKDFIAQDVPIGTLQRYSFDLRA